MLRSSLQLAKARPDYVSGLRAATATVVPLVAGEVLHRPALVWVALGGWLTSMVDGGGPYAARANAMAAYTLGGSALLAVTGLCAGSVPVSAVVLFVALTVLGTLRIYGEAAARAAVLSQAAVCIGLGTPTLGSHEALVRSALLAAGGVLAMVLALGFWPMRPYKPAREALARCWEGLAAQLGALAALVDARAPEAEWTASARTGRMAVRDALEAARVQLVAVRATRQGETLRGERLLVLFGVAELALGTVAALTEALQDAAVDPERLRRASGLAASLAPALRNEETIAPPPPLPAAGSSESELLLRELESQLQGAVDVARGLSGAAVARPLVVPQSPSLRDALRPGSLVLRHALRVAVAATGALLAADVLHLHRTHWATVTVVIVLQPQFGATTQRALQRTLGTIAGAAIAAVLTPRLNSPALVGLALFPLSLLAVALRPLNYGLYAALLTPVFLLLASSAPGSDHIVLLRIQETLLGGGFALVAAWLLWPAWERTQLPATLSSLLDALARYAGASDVVAARREVGVAASNAEASFQRYLGEPHDDGEVEPAMAVLAWSRRPAGSLTAAWAAHVERTQVAPVQSDLAALSQALQAGVQPPELTFVAGDSPQAVRVAVQLRALHGAVSRLMDLRSPRPASPPRTRSPAPT